MKVKKSIISILIASGMLLIGCSSNEYNGVKYSLKEDNTLIENDNLYLSLYENSDDLMKFLMNQDLLPKTQSEFRLSGSSDKSTVRVHKGLVNGKLAYRVLNPQLEQETNDKSTLNTFYTIENSKIEKIDLDTIGVYGFDGDEDGEYSHEYYDIKPKSENIDKELKKSEFTIEHGEILNETITGDILVIKAKIKPSYSNDATISQNAFNVEDIIKNQDGDKFKEIQYWAVADMNSGDESKVISFTLNEELIKSVKNGETLGNKIIEKSNDVWILQSLKN